MKYRLQSRCHCKVTIIIFWVKIKICAILLKVYSFILYFTTFRFSVENASYIYIYIHTREFFPAVYHKNVPGGADFPERNNLSASNRAEERFIRPAARTFRVGEIYYIAYRILTIFPFRSISVQVTRHRVPYIISRVSSDHGRTLFTTLCVILD